MSKGWGFVARHVARERVCLLSSQANVEDMLMKLIKTLKLLSIVENVIVVDDNVSFSAVCNIEKPCVVLDTSCGYTQRHSIWILYRLLYIPDCVVLLISSFITAVPESFLQFTPCLLWEKPYWVHLPYIARSSSIVKKFMEQERRAFCGDGHVFCIGRRNVCCKVELDDTCLTEALVSQRVVKAQRRFRSRRLCVIVIQQAVKQWLYRPQSTLGKQIVERLTSSCQVK
jgi:hypothetical protein